MVVDEPGLLFLSRRLLLFLRLEIGWSCSVKSVVVVVEIIHDTTRDIARQTPRGVPLIWLHGVLPDCVRRAISICWSLRDRVQEVVCPLSCPQERPQEPAADVVKGNEELEASGGKLTPGSAQGHTIPTEAHHELLLESIDLGETMELVWGMPRGLELEVSKGCLVLQGSPAKLYKCREESAE
eukprot:CAMPEP_0118969368 /NCGR_PEP_ID=MMETSP1173-20130426/6472_1 /TAXON_ID=1034831 /ORGANISM="Rhizochromulina marina cf, Strain CCMP1243" /LENGTH=182 /DNA_ID=CAMNT_0006918601 /DNA_START=709 /DNA_END=1257 /DNA_ORIENTATION=+